MAALEDVYAQQKQSPWLDNLRRAWMLSGELQKLIDRGVRGLTSNPSIFAAAMMTTNDYDAELEELVKAGFSVDDAYWKMAVADVNTALGLLRPVFDSSGGEDGYVSIEVSPTLAHEEAATVAAARQLDDLISAPNLYVKVPATLEGIPAIETLISEGRSINVTLIFSLKRYASVMEAYIAGLENADDATLSSVSSVASFFISRVDTEVDRRLTEIGTEEALALKGKAAIAQAKLAYKLFGEKFSGPRWEALAAKGARKQRPLWASTSTKDPSYSDTLYVDELIGPDTVNTLPEKTLLAFDEHGTVARTIDANVDDAEAVVAKLSALGIDLEEVAQKLEAAGVASFATAFEDVLEVLGKRAAEFS